MKYLIVVLLTICAANAWEKHLRDGVTPRKFPAVNLPEGILSKIEWEDLRTHIESKYPELRDGFIQADVTDYALKILANIQNIIIYAGLDPMQLSDETINLFPGSLALSNGWIQDLSTITVYDSVIAKYSAGSKILELTLPLSFDALLLDYDYHVQVLLLGLSGSLDSKISHLKLNLHMGFNFTEYHAFVDNLDVKDSGSISITFTGLGLLDWIIDLMTNALVAVFHKLILSIVNAIIYIPVQDVVKDINQIFDAILHPNSTNTTSFMMNY